VKRIAAPVALGVCMVTACVAHAEKEKLSEIF
jgi:outer membrane murein-binding lipoprotein Lpp